MARPKGAKNKRHVFQDPTVEEVVEMEIEVKDPVTGKMIRQKVKVKKLKRIKVEHKTFIGANDLIDELDKSDISDAPLDQEE